MDISIFLARLLGLYMVIMIIALVVRRENLLSLVRELRKHDACLFMMTLISLLAGLALVLVHNIWVSDWRVVITILSWYIVAKNVAWMMFPKALSRMAETIMKDVGTGFVITIGGLLGIWLLIQGFGM